jgi:hypothetical protein
MALGNECDVCGVRANSISVENFCGLHGVDPTCLNDVQRGEIERVLFLADEQVASYAGWWPAPTQLCEEIPVGIRYGTCLFTRAGAARGITLRYGKVTSIDQVEFMRRPSRSCQGVTPGEGDEVETGAICVVDAEYGAIELDDRVVAQGGYPRDIERVRIHYTAGRCDPLVHPLLFLLARYAATLLGSPLLCGVDLRCGPWDTFTLTDTEDETTTTQEESRTDAPGGVTTVVRAETVNRRLVTTDQQRYPQNPSDFESPFGHLPAQVALWRYLRPRRRVRILRV